MEFAFSYTSLFVKQLVFAWPLLGMIMFTIMMLGGVVGKIESWGRFDSIYWAFITATTVGYGDIRPLRPVSRVISIVIALAGIIFTGLLVALAVNAATLALEHVDVSFRAVPRDLPAAE